MVKHHTCCCNYDLSKGNLMELLYIFALYFIVSALLYILMNVKCKKNPVFLMPKDKQLFYVLSFTWGFPAVFSGAIAALFIRVFGYKSTRYGWIWRFEIPNIDWGTSFGLFFVAPKGNEQISMHEHGHAIQNIYLGPFYPAVVWLPSVVRFWFRKIRLKNGKKPKKNYADIWFENSSDESGTFFMKRLNKTV